jgi:pyruvate formate lyase activating enzyme
MTVDEVMKILLKDKMFYQESGGGITISGGDPLSQHTFVRSILSKAKENGLHTALETCLQGQKAHLESLLPCVDLVFTDIKILDSREHEKYTGFRNETILENFKFISGRNIPVVVRIPLIPDITVHEENLRGIARFVSTAAPSVPIELINYNPLARDKYRIMSRPYTVPQDAEPFTEAELNRFREIILSEGAVLYNET